MTRLTRGSTRLGLAGALVAGVALVAIALRLLLPGAEGEAGAGDGVAPADGAAASSPVPPPAQVAERQRRASVMQDDEAPGAAAVDLPELEPEGEVTDGAATRLDRIGASFLSADPDFAGFNEFNRWLAIVADVVPESVETDPETGTIRGKLSIPGSSLEGTFEIDGDTYRIGVDSNEAGAVEEPFIQRDMTVLFADAHGVADGAGAGIQFHPDTRRNDLAPAGEERYVGWSLSAGEGGRARPLSMRKSAAGRGWEIGHTKGLPQQQGSWLLDTTPHQMWLDKLKHHK